MTATSGMNLTGVNFSMFTPASISGYVYGDFDGDGIREAGEAGLSGKTIYLDANNNGTLDTGEVTTTADA